MQNKLIQRVPGLAAFDQFLLLNFPRLWLSRVHMVVIGAGAIFGVLLLFTLLVIRPMVQPSYTALTSGGQAYECAPKPTMREQAECAIPVAYRELSSGISTSLILMDVAISVFGALVAMLWLRAQARYSVEAMHGQNHWYSAWVEWGCYALGIGLIFGAGWVIRVGLTPSPAQIRTFDEVAGQYRAELWLYTLPTNLHFPVRRDPSPPRSGYSDQWLMDVAPGSPEAAHLQRIADTAYASALGARTEIIEQEEYSGDAPLLLQFIPWLLIVGYGAYIVYASKRQRWVHVFIAFLLSNVLVFVAFFVLALFASLLYAIFNGRQGEEFLLGLMVVGLMAGLVVTALQLGRALIIRRFSVGAALGTIALPWVVAFVPIVLLATTFSNATQSWLGWHWKPQQQSDAVAFAVAIAPYISVPFLPLIDKALVRLGALPSN